MCLEVSSLLRPSGTGQLMMRGEGRTNLKLKRGLVTNSASPSSHTVWLEEKLDLQAKGPIIYYLFDARSRSPYQDINKVSSFSRCLVGTKCYLSSLIFYCRILERLLHTLTRGLLAVVGGLIIRSTHTLTSFLSYPVVSTNIYLCFDFGSTFAPCSMTIPKKVFYYYYWLHYIYKGVVILTTAYLFRKRNHKI